MEKDKIDFIKIAKHLIKLEEDSLLDYLNANVQISNAHLILDNGLLFGFKEISRKFVDGELFVPDVILVAKLFNKAVFLLKPYINQLSQKNNNKILMATIEGDLHDLGKNIASVFFIGGGYQVIDLGVDVSADIILDEIKLNEPDIIGISALLTPVVPEVKKTIKKIRKVSKNIKIIVGGVAFNESIAEKIGADAYCSNAGFACAIAEKLLKNIYE